MNVDSRRNWLILTPGYANSILPAPTVVSWSDARADAEVSPEIEPSEGCNALSSPRARFWGAWPSMRRCRTSLASLGIGARGIRVSRHNLVKRPWLLPEPVRARCNVRRWLKEGVDGNIVVGDSISMQAPG